MSKNEAYLRLIFFRNTPVVTIFELWFPFNGCND